MGKRKATMEFSGLGFPITLLNAPMITTEHGETLDVDFGTLQDAAFEALIRKPGRFLGAEVKFVRQFLKMTQNVFADFLGVDRSLVGKWEAKDLDVTGMMMAAEVLLRMQMVRHLKGSLDREMTFIEPAVRKSKPVPIELSPQ